jgi:hypothetical protein
MKRLAVIEHNNNERTGFPEKMALFSRSLNLTFVARHLSFPLRAEYLRHSLAAWS